MAGGFVWTAFDYHGEPTPFKWPANSSYFGILDLCGFRKSAFYIHRALWVKDRPLLDILPHWNWQGREGQLVKVQVATNLDRIELRLNGKLVGQGTPDPYEMISFDVPFEPGVLEARGWKGSKAVAASTVETTDVPVKLLVTADRAWLTGNGIDAQPLTVQAVDAKGRPVPTANFDIELNIAGGRIIGIGNGDPTSTAPSKGTSVRMFNGLAQVIVQTDRGSSGALTLSATASGLIKATTVIEIRPGSVIEALPPVNRQALQSWRQSPVFPKRPATIPDLADNDMNSWAIVSAGDTPSPAPSDGWVILSCRISLGGTGTKRSAVLNFAGVAGSGDLLVNGQVVAHKDEERSAPMRQAVPAGSRELTIGLILKAVEGQPVGLPGAVFLEN
jgi:beta-galactosidase